MHESASGPCSAAQLLTSDWPMWDEFRRLGCVEGQNLPIERFCGEGRAAHYPDLARDVVRRNPDVIIAFKNERAGPQLTFTFQLSRVLSRMASKTSARSVGSDGVSSAERNSPFVSIVVAHMRPLASMTVT